MVRGLLLVFFRWSPGGLLAVGGFGRWAPGGLCHGFVGALYAKET